MSLNTTIQASPRSAFLLLSSDIRPIEYESRRLTFLFYSFVFVSHFDTHWTTIHRELPYHNESKQSEEDKVKICHRQNSISGKIQFQAKLILLLGAISDLILTRHNSLKRNLSIRRQLMPKSTCVVDRVGSISEGVFAMRDFFDLCSYRQSSREGRPHRFVSTPALIGIVRPTELDQAVSSIIQREHTWLNQLHFIPNLIWEFSIRRSKLMDIFWRTPAGSTTSRIEGWFCLTVVASSTTSSARDRLCLTSVTNRDFAAINSD